MAKESMQAPNGTPSPYPELWRNFIGGQSPSDKPAPRAPMAKPRNPPFRPAQIEPFPGRGTLLVSA